NPNYRIICIGRMTQVIIYHSFIKAQTVSPYQSIGYGTIIYMTIIFFSRREYILKPVQVFHIHHIGYLCLIHVKRLDVLLGWSVIPVMHHIILYPSHGISTTFNKYKTWSCFLLFKIGIVLETTFLRINVPTSGPGVIFGFIGVTAK